MTWADGSQQSGQGEGHSQGGGEAGGSDEDL